MTNPRFPSFEELQTAHDALLDRRDQLNGAINGTPQFFDEVESFVARARATGALLDGSRERRASQSILDFRTSALLRVHRPANESRLADFDAELAPQLPDEPCPYQGLAAFGESDSAFFFGREALIEDMLAQLREQRLLTVVGASGSGKSSVVLAGLIPAMKSGPFLESDGWRYVILVPGSDPTANLAAALPVVGGKLVVVVDQFEETFTLCTDQRKRETFARQLIELFQTPAQFNRVILTMRADFVDSVVKLPQLQPLFEQAQVDVKALSINELRAAIEGPAAKVGLKFEEGIVDDMIETILGERAGLPLLQFTLLKLWEQRKRNRITREVYRAVGDPREALERSAETYFISLIPQNQEAVKRTLLKMVQPTEGLEFTSNRVPRANMYEGNVARDRVEEVLDQLIHKVRLVKETTGVTEVDTQVEIAHEALVRNWPRLVEWLDREREEMRQRRLLTDVAHRWRDSGREPSFLLRGRVLEDTERRQDLNEVELEFIRASQEAAAEERKALERALMLEGEAKAARRLRVLSVGLLVFGLLAVIAAMIAFNALSQVQAANASAARFRSGQLASLAEDQWQAGNREIAFLMAMEAVASARTVQAENVVRLTLPRYRVMRPKIWSPS